MANPVSFLRRLGQEAADSERAVNLARTALNDAIHFGRPQAVIDDLARKLAAMEGPPSVQVEVPRAALDPVSVEYAAIGGPRSWAEQRIMTAAGESALENADGPTSEAMDALRSNALTEARLARMTPEQRAQSIAALAFQAADDARAARMAQAAARERQRAQAKAVAGALGKAGVAAGIGGMTGVSLGVVSSNIADRQREEQNVFAEQLRRFAERRAVSQQMNDDLAKMTGAINFAPDADDISGIAADMANDIRGVPSPEPDIFTEDPAIILADEDQRAAIQRVLQQRYGR